MLTKLGNAVPGPIKKLYRMKQVHSLFRAGLPPQMAPALRYLVSGECDEEAQAVAKRAEGRRSAIASEGKKEVPIWYSPKPASAGADTSLDARPEPGEVLLFTMERVSKTGKDRKWGTVLHLIAREFAATNGIELGSCAGLSAIYLSSVSSMKKLVTIEGSQALAEIARKSLESFPHATVINGLFDEALDSELPTYTDKLDFAFIDGHHEKVATIHYFNRLLPYLREGAVVIFDDISWSHDMREAWEELSVRPEFSHTIDLGAIGVCVLKHAAANIPSEPARWNLQPIVGRRPIGDPKGWKESAPSSNQD